MLSARTVVRACTPTDWNNDGNICDDRWSYRADLPGCWRNVHKHLLHAPAPRTHVVIPCQPKKERSGLLTCSDVAIYDLASHKECVKPDGTHQPQAAQPNARLVSTNVTIHALIVLVREYYSRTSTFAICRNFPQIKTPHMRGAFLYI